MHKSLSYIILSCMTASHIVSCPLSAKIAEEMEKIEAPMPFSSFAGKITKNKVRMRLAASLDSPVLKELNKDDLFIILSEDEDFYGISAPSDIKAYVYRTFVLDNVVEGNHVNVRLEPTLDAPVIAQLNSGDSVEGKISQMNSKWLEIPVPQATKFYIAKDFVEKIGEPSLVETISKRRENTNRLLESTYQIAEVELEKQYQQIQMDGIFQNLNKIMADKNNLPEQIDKARAMLTNIQDKYLQKKIAFLEEKPAQVFVTRLNESSDQPTEFSARSDKFSKNPITAKMSRWFPVEDCFFSNLLQQNPDLTKEQFYQEQKQSYITVKGLVEAYDRAIKNKPGDYVLLDSSSRLPLAYLYSTEINLQDVLGEEVTLQATPRPNNDFAFPAYFILGIDQSI